MGSALGSALGAVGNALSNSGLFGGGVPDDPIGDSLSPASGRQLQGGGGPPDGGATLMPTAAQGKARNSNLSCNQTFANAGNLDYSQKLFKNNTQTTQDHIIERHMSGLNGVSQYNAKDFQQVRNLNALTFYLGYQREDNGSVVFEFTVPDFAAAYLHLKSFLGTDDRGQPTLTNRLVVLPNCKTTVTSYPIP